MLSPECGVIELYVVNAQFEDLFQQTEIKYQIIFRQLKFAVTLG